MPNLSTFTEKTIPVEANVRGEKVNLTVLPYRWTIEAEQRFMAEAGSEDPERIGRAVIDFFINVVSWWDITDDDGNMVPLAPEALTDFPTVLLHEILDEAKTAISFRKRR